MINTLEICLPLLFNMQPLDMLLDLTSKGLQTSQKTCHGSVVLIDLDISAHRSSKLIPKHP